MKSQRWELWGISTKISDLNMVWAMFVHRQLSQTSLVFFFLQAQVGIHCGTWVCFAMPGCKCCTTNVDLNGSDDPLFVGTIYKTRYCCLYPQSGLEDSIKLKQVQYSMKFPQYLSYIPEYGWLYHGIRLLSPYTSSIPSISHEYALTVGHIHQIYNIPVICHNIRWKNHTGWCPSSLAKLVFKSNNYAL